MTIDGLGTRRMKGRYYLDQLLSLFLIEANKVCGVFPAIDFCLFGCPRHGGRGSSSIGCQVVNCARCKSYGFIFVGEKT